MFCLVCEKRIPLHRQLAGSPFCSKEHRQQHAARSAASKKAPAKADFAPNPPAFAPSEPHPNATAFHTPIPRFCDVILARKYLKPRYTMGAVGASQVGGSPRPAPPETSRTIRPGPEIQFHFLLGMPFSSSLDSARRLSTAKSQGEIVAKPWPVRFGAELGASAGFQPTPWNASFRMRWLGASRAPAKGLRLAAFGHPDLPGTQ